MAPLSFYIMGKVMKLRPFVRKVTIRIFAGTDKVSFVRSLHEDLKRRDFTMNAIAMSKEGKLIDPLTVKEI